MKSIVICIVWSIQQYSVGTKVLCLPIINYYTLDIKSSVKQNHHKQLVMSLNALTEISIFYEVFAQHRSASYMLNYSVFSTLTWHCKQLVIKHTHKLVMYV